MTRILKVGAAQLGPIQRDNNRKEVVERLIALLHKGAAESCDLVVFPELALTTFSRDGGRKTYPNSIIFSKPKCRIKKFSHYLIRRKN